MPEDLKNTQHEPHANAAALVARFYCQPEDPALEGSLLESQDKASHLSTYLGDKSAAGMVFIKGCKDVRIVPSEDFTVDLKGCLQVVGSQSPDYDGILEDRFAYPVLKPPLNLFLWPHSLFAWEFPTEIVYPTGIEKGLRRLSVDWIAANINTKQEIEEEEDFIEGIAEGLKDFAEGLYTIFKDDDELEADFMSHKIFVN